MRAVLVSQSVSSVFSCDFGNVVFAWMDSVLGASVCVCVCVCVCACVRAFVKKEETLDCLPVGRYPP